MEFEIKDDVLYRYQGDEETVIVPEGVKVIKSNAIRFCQTMRELVLPESVEEIEDEAIYGCSNLLTFNIPKGVREIGESRYGDYWKLDVDSISIDPDNPYYYMEGGIVYRRDDNRFIIIPRRLPEIVHIPDGIVKLPEMLFAYQNRLVEMSIPDSVIDIGKGCFKQSPALERVRLPKGIQRLPEDLFFECESLRDVELPENLEIIGRCAFYMCQSLSRIHLPDSVNEIEEFAFYGCKGLADENGFVIMDNVLHSYVKEDLPVVVPDHVQVIRKGALYMLGPIQIPDSVIQIEPGAFDLYNIDRIKMPHAFLQRVQKLDPDLVEAMLRNNKFTTNEKKKDCAALLLFQSSKKIHKEVANRTKGEADGILQAMIELLRENGTAGRYKKAAEYYFEHKDEIEQSTADELYKAAADAKAKKVTEMLAPYVRVESGTEEDSASGKESASKAKDQSKQADPIEAFCNENYVPQVFEKFLKKIKLKESLFKSVMYKESAEKAPAFVVECAVLPYMQQLKEIPKKIGDYQNDYTRFELDADADRVADALDPETFGQMLDKLLGKDLPAVYHVMVPYCRYASGAQVSALITRMNKWQKWDQYSATGRKSIIIARGALMLNDSREAMLYTDKVGHLREYARMRGLDKDVMRDNTMSDFGLDENGKRVFDLGNTTLELSINKELKVSMFDVGADKAVKSVPKRGADEEKYEEVKTEVADIRKNLKAIVKNRTELLYDAFLQGNTRKALGWKASYLKNYILHKIGELVVWSQKKKTFILTEDGVIDCFGNAFEINDKDNISVAHPMFMKLEERKAWQHYFVSNGLKQPFEQVWEPVINLDNVKPERYKSYMIPYYKFLNKEKQGISVYDMNFHNDISFFFADCRAQVNRVDFERHNIQMDHRFEIAMFSIVKKSRRSNHIVSYLDRITLTDRIMGDDTSIMEIIGDYSLAQITEFISAANENNCNNVLAALIDYKNTNYGDFDPMDAFVLD